MDAQTYVERRYSVGAIKDLRTNPKSGNTHLTTIGTGVLGGQDFFMTCMPVRPMHSPNLIFEIDKLGFSRFSWYAGAPGLKTFRFPLSTRELSRQAFPDGFRPRTCSVVIGVLERPIHNADVALNTEPKEVTAGEHLVIVHHSPRFKERLKTKVEVGNRKMDYYIEYHHVQGAHFPKDGIPTPGSVASGSPVFNKHGDLVALHFSGSGKLGYAVHIKVLQSFARKFLRSLNANHAQIAMFPPQPVLVPVVYQPMYPSPVPYYQPQLALSYYR